MKNTFIFCFLYISCLLFFPEFVYAKYDPLSVPNNKYGIHIVDPNDMGDAAKLVNSSNGDWGYVTLVIQDDDRDIGKWQRIFNEMRGLHLVPLVRLATHIDGDSWVKPYKDSASDWAKFLNSLNWPTENRYVIVFNEPNHANEWGKSIDPEQYARVLREHADKLRAASEDFFVLPAGLDVSAASDGKSLDAAVYLSRMLKAEPSLFDVLDGWTSHAYPNPAFSGSPYATGRGTLRSFQWELQYLKSLGVTKRLPVFITETGWVHREGVMTNYSLASSEQVGANLVIAANTVWNDPAVVAVTPFVLSYQGLPFDHFSWKKLGSSEYYPQYGIYQGLIKTHGQPRQRERYTTDHTIIPSSLVAGSTYVLSTLLKNEGQGILSEKDSQYELRFVVEPSFLMVHDPLPIMEPNQYGTLTMHIETPNTLGKYTYDIQLVHHSVVTSIEKGEFTLVPPPSITIQSHLGWRTTSDTSNATILIYDKHALIHKEQGVVYANGKASIKELRNVVPGNIYRVVSLVPYYLPSQRILKLKADGTLVDLPRSYPLDFDLDGALTIRDIFAVVKMQPNFITSLFIGP